MLRGHRASLAALLAALLLTAPSTAVAHDELSGTDPEDGASIEAPAEVTLDFTGAIADIGAAVQVTGPDGAAVEGAPVVDGPQVVQDLVDDLPDGDYEVAWRVTSEDGHPISGTFGFTVTAGTSADASGDDSTSDESATDASETAGSESAAEPSTEPATSAQDTAEATQDGTGQAAVAEPTGLPGWAWGFIVVSTVALLAALAWTWRRGRA